MPERFLGRTLGKYRVEELIGSGGFAWVYRGYDPELEIPVAIKVLKPQFGGDPAFEERFRREASTAAKLRHPNIIKIYAVGRDGDAVYFVMDYLPSGLADKLEKTPTLPEEFVIRVGVDVARALGFAHREGVIHRDIKVDNIMFDIHGNAVVADFGIARAVSGYTQQTGTNMVVGTPQYFAPEQARAKPLDGRADIYSLGVTLYRAVTGRLPFEGDDWYEIARQHVEEPPPPPQRFNPNISDEFARVLLRCMAKHPDDRPLTGEELSDELTAILDERRTGASGTVRSRTVSVTPSQAPTVIAPIGGKSSRRVPKRIYVITIIVIAALGGLAVPLLARLRNAVASGANGDSLAVIDAPAVVPSDSLVRDTSAIAVTPDSSPTSTIGARRDSMKPPPSMGRLSVTIPPDARLSVNGLPVGEGKWRSDTLKPGDYALVATIESIDGCETARTEQVVKLRPGPVRDVTLTPKACGTLSVDSEPNGLFFSMVSSDGLARREGNLPLEAPLVVPVGQYHLMARKPQCAQFDQDVTVSAGQNTSIRIRMICPTP